MGIERHTSRQTERQRMGERESYKDFSKTSEETPDALVVVVSTGGTEGEGGEMMMMIWEKDDVRVDKAGKWWKDS